MGKKRILVANNEEAVGIMLAMALEVCDFEIDIVKNGVEAMNQISKKPYDLIITDYMMPQMDGLELTRKIRTQNPSSPPILMLIGDDGPVDDFLRSGATACIKKPFKVLDVQIMAKMILGR
jgi:two-component system alkaline phosphatase synthesis response regulator PhoP